MNNDGLPAGWCLSLDPNARRTDGGRGLIGGSPLRILRLSEAGSRWLDRVLDGEPLAPIAAQRALARRLSDAGIAIPHPDGGSGPGAEDVAVVIPVLDSPHGLRCTLAAVGSFSEVVVVDDGSRDADAIAHAASGATVLRNDRTAGPGDARQRGWQATIKPLVAFIDTDVEVDAGWLSRLLAHFADPTIGAVAPRICPRPGSAPPLIDRFEAVRSPLDLGPLGAPVRPGSRVPYVPTALLVVRRDALESVGGFDPHLRVGEDVDLVWRLNQAGWRVRYDPTVIASHPSRPSIREWARQRFDYGKSTGALAHRHGVAVAPISVSPRSALAWALVLVGWPRTALIVGAATTASLAPKLRELDHPAREALILAGKDNLAAGRLVADAFRRPWWPLSALLALSWRRTRPALFAAVVAPPLVEWLARRPKLDPARYALFRLAEDLAYGTGVWIGAMRGRTIAALRPTFATAQASRRRSGSASVSLSKFLFYTRTNSSIDEDPGARSTTPPSVRRLVRTPPTSRRDRPRPASRTRSHLLPSVQRPRNGLRPSRNQSPLIPGRFN